jgi:hypothetical protein
MSAVFKDAEQNGDEDDESQYFSAAHSFLVLNERTNLILT